MKKIGAIIIGVAVITGLVYYYYFQKIYTVKKVFPHLFDTYFEITLVGKNPSHINSTIDEVHALIKQYEQMLNFYNKDSEISKVNQHAKKSFIELSPELMELIKVGIKYEQLSNRKYSILTGEFKKVYGDVLSSGVPPLKKHINLILKDFMSGKIKIKDNSIKFSNSGISIDPGSIAKGYVIDKAINYCKKQNIIAGIINGGGDLKVFSSQKYRKWRIGIQHPRNKDKMLKIIELYNGSLATSGDYERSIDIDGTRFHHIIDTISGYPADKNISSTVVTDNCLDADVLSTLFFVMNEKERSRFVKKSDLNISYYVMDKNLYFIQVTK